MLKVLLVDDEPFILQGIKVIIDWEKEGFEIAATAENGLEALEYLKKEKVDLIIADIRMPGMTGLELLEQIRREEISDAYFVILSGYAEFDYARRAMQNKCTEYLLKPVDRETLLKLLHKVRALSDRERQESKAHEEMEHAYFSRHLISLIHGKYDDVNLNYVKKHMKDTQGIRYVEIQKEQPNNLEEQSDKDLWNFQRELYDCCREFLKEDAKHCVFDVSADEKIYDIGFVYSENLAERLGMDDKTYLSAFRQYLVNNTKQPVIMLVGKKYQISAMWQDRMVMPVCSALFRGSGHEKKSIIMRMKCRLQRLEWSYANRGWISFLPPLNRITTWRSGKQ